MKILSTSQIREADALTIKNKPLKSINLMERAAGVCREWLRKNINLSQKVAIFCGMGNNGGDGLAIARMLSNEIELYYLFNEKRIHVYIIKHTDKCSADFAINEKRLKTKKNVKVTTIAETKDIRKIKLADNEIIIDAIFGSGLSKPLSGVAAETVDFINEQNAVVVSIDIPSGLFGDDNSINKYKHVVKADYTLTFQLPKLAFLLPENDMYVGKWIILPIGLDESFIDKTNTKYFFTTENDIKQIFKKRAKFSHKGTYGHALLIAGSHGKMGAAVLGSKACLRSGVGLLTAHVPRCGYEIIQSSVPEAMADIDAFDKHITQIPDVSKYNAIAVGPGIGTDDVTQQTLKLLIQESTIPLIFDADAINILSENKTWLSFIPKNCIFTPHPKEFERLVGKAENSTKRIQLQCEFSIKYHAYVILKGAHTSISCPDGSCYFNSTGNPGMATAGSGDVLTGIILGLMAQGYSSKESALMGVYIHGMAGDFACKKQGQTSLIADDIIANLGKAFRLFE